MTSATSANSGRSPTSESALACAYYLKEDLRQIRNQPHKATAQVVLEDWIRRADASGVQMLKKFAKTLASYRSGILAY
jgi:transposase